MYSGSDALAHLLRVVFVAAVLLGPVTGNAQLKELDDDVLSDITGQNGSLFLSDHIGPNELTGAPADGTANFDFYRMGLDAKMSFNLNIAKFQLGCGGVNDLLTTSPACDLDIDYLGFMGINAAGDRPAYNAANADVNGNYGPDSAFELLRPYLELAIKNDDTRTLREVVGIKIGGEKINGAIRMGRDYTGLGSGLGPESNLTNLENGGVCNPGATTGAGVVNCHSGLNSISGYLAGLELSAGFRARASLCTVFLGCIWPFYLSIPVNMDGCIGRINFNPCSGGDTPFFIDAGGTRLSSLYVAAAKLRLEPDLLLGFDLEGYGSLELDTRQIHYLLTPNSSGFFLSMQREPVSWPNYEKTPPPNNLIYDACNPAYGQVTSRCSSAYATRANTGWWLAAANAKMLNLQPGNRIILPGRYNSIDLLSALGPNSSPIHIENPKLDFVAARNCYGTAIFC
ncbi:MAG: hypothetical protein P1U64_06430 [Alcanivoracaceae bacterium]|nr:hypothetical protein [Alcanivoracaceae bacterium]